MRKLAAVALFVLAVGTAAAAADTYPSRTITIVAPYPAGGPTDTIARLLAERM
jgi:tripartite-type tricarboxylate transporter receptor subunit TctC